MQRLRARALLVMLAVFGLISACGGPIAPAGTGASDGAVAVASPAPSAARASAAPASTRVPTPNERATDEPTPTERATDEPTGTAIAEPSTSATVNITDVLGVEWVTDSDGNQVPDAVEQELGSDPAVEDCPLQDCGDVPAGTSFDTEQNVLILFDSSGSMAAAIGSERKIDVAKRAVEQYLRIGSIAANVGLLVYGHKGNNTDAGKPESCAGVEILAPLGQANDATASQLVGSFEPTGWTPIAGALEKAQEAFAGREGQINRILIISDGIETCDGDPVAVAQRLNSEGLKVTIDVIGFDLQEEGAVEQLKAVAEAGGGTFYDARAVSDFQNYLREQIGKLTEGVRQRTCATRNLSALSICRGQFYVNAELLVYRLKQEEQDDARAQAYQLVWERISAARDENSKAAVEASKQASEAQRQLNELERAVREALNNGP